MFFWIILFAVIYFAMKAVFNNKKKSDLHLAKSTVQRCRICPECAEGIKVEAKKCRYCGCSLMPCSEEELTQIEEAYSNELHKLEHGDIEQPVNKKYQNPDVWK
jgi:hypothetical protein